MTIKKEPDDNIYCHQAPSYNCKDSENYSYSIHIEKIIRSNIPIIRRMQEAIEH